jgi:hypothetical protein
VRRDDALVVQPQQRDHIVDVVLVADPARRGPLRVGEDGVGHDPPLLHQLGPDPLGEGEVRRVVAVQVADLAAAQPEAELAAAAEARLDSRPRRDLVGDLAARRSWRGHRGSSGSPEGHLDRTTSSELEVKGAAGRRRDDGEA